MDRPAIFITGAAAGIGRATARLFCSLGWFSGLYDLNEPALAELRDELGAEKSCCARLDVTDPASVKSAVAHFGEATGGRMNALFNCSGILRTGPFMEIPSEDNRPMIDINVRGVVDCTFESFPLLKRTPGSHVISMSSGSALYGTPDFAVYSATKFAVSGFTEALDIEWEKHGIAVSDIKVPFVATGMVRNARRTAIMSRMRTIRPEVVAELVWRAAHGRRLHWLAPRDFAVTSWITDKLPASINRFLMKKLSGY